jgi:ABC-type transport system involved in resistance to organic solvents, ATPase component
MISVEHVHKAFDGNKVLSDISTQFSQGNINMIIGASGSGKTVLMKCIVGLHEPSSGQIYYNDREFTCLSYDQKKNLRKEMGMLFQGSALFDSLNVEENVGFALRIFTQKTNKEVRERVDSCLERVNLGKVNKLYPSELSGGMKKRVGIARAIAMNPAYLFVDEPNSGLDPQTASVIDNLIKEITVDFNVTTVINTHDMNSIFEIGEHILFLHQGNKWWEGTPSQIQQTTNPELQAFVYSSEFIRQRHAGD